MKKKKSNMQRAKRKNIKRATSRIQRNSQHRKQVLNIIGRMTAEDRVKFFGDELTNIPETEDKKQRSWNPKVWSIFSKFLAINTVKNENVNPVFPAESETSVSDIKPRPKTVIDSDLLQMETRAVKKVTSILRRTAKSQD